MVKYCSHIPEQDYSPVLLILKGVSFKHHSLSRREFLLYSNLHISATVPKFSFSLESHSVHLPQGRGKTFAAAPSLKVPELFLLSPRLTRVKLLGEAAQRLMLVRFHSWITSLVFSSTLITHSLVMPRSLGTSLFFPFIFSCEAEVVTGVTGQGLSEKLMSD